MFGSAVPLLPHERVVGHESKGAMLQYLGCQGCNNGKGLNMQVSQHFIRAPTAQEWNHVSVYFGTQQGHGAG